MAGIYHQLILALCILEERCGCHARDDWGHTYAGADYAYQDSTVGIEGVKEEERGVL